MVQEPPACPSDRAVDRRNVRAHYDIDNGFFALMLDQTMTLLVRPVSSVHTSRAGPGLRLIDLCAIGDH